KLVSDINTVVKVEALFVAIPTDGVTHLKKCHNLRVVNVHIHCHTATARSRLTICQSHCIVVSGMGHNTRGLLIGAAVCSINAYTTAHHRELLSFIRSSGQALFTVLDHTQETTDGHTIWSYVLF